MSMIMRNPRRSMTRSERPLSLFDELAREMWTSWPFRYQEDVFTKVDILEEKDALVIKAELPGVKKDDVDITVAGDTLTIKAEKKTEEVSEEANYFTCERSFGTLTRTISLPFAVDPDKASSTYENGVLEIRLPKSEESKSRHITIKSK